MDFNKILEFIYSITLIQLISYVMMLTQMAGWFWAQSLKGGKLTDNQYYLFCALLMVGQIGASIECVFNNAIGTLVTQAYFFIATILGGVNRYRNQDSKIQSKIKGE